MDIQNTLHFLVVEDDPDQIEVIRFRLSEAISSHTLKEFFCGEDMLEHLRNELSQESPNLPDIIILDLNLPGKGGLEILKEIKSENKLKDIAVIVNTSSLSKNDIVDSYRSGGTFFMNKEWDDDIFKNAIEQIRILKKS